MSRWRRFLFRLRQTSRHSRQNAEMEEELRLHLEMRIERNVANGMSPEEARYAALRAFGGVDQIKEQARRERTLVPIEAFGKDVRFAVRQLRKTPGFTAIAVLSLALGIGANTAVFSLANAVLLYRLPVKQPGQLVVFNWLAEKNVFPKSWGGWTQLEPGSDRITSTSFSYLTFAAFQHQTGMLSDVFAFTDAPPLTTIIDGDAEQVSNAQLVSGGYFSGLGVRAAAGRLISSEDDLATAPAVTVISYDFWQQRFGGDPSVLGREISVNGVPTTIIGVTDRAFYGAMQVGDKIDLTFPLALEKQLTHASSTAPDPHRPSFWWLRIMGRMRPGVSMEQVQSSLEGVFWETARDNVHIQTAPGAPPVDAAHVPLPRLRVHPGAQGLYEALLQDGKSLRLLLGLVGLVLLIACFNVANLLLARGQARRREIAMRIALGAGRGRIVRQLLTESVLLATLGSLLGLALAVWGSRVLLLMRLFGSRSPNLGTSLDWRVLALTSAVTIATGVFFGLVPALKATKVDLTQEFQGGPRTSGADTRTRLPKLLMALQVALSLVLLTGTGLLVRTLRNLQNLDLGFNRDHLLIFRVNASAGGATVDHVSAVYRELRDKIAALPATTQASFVRIPPLNNGTWSDRVVVPGYQQTAPGEYVILNAVDLHYFATMQIPLLRGRSFTARDFINGAPNVAVVDQRFAMKYFQTEDVIGRHFNLGDELAKENDVEIIGLARNALYSSVRGSHHPAIILPYGQFTRGPIAVSFLVRYSGPEAAMAENVRVVVHNVAPTIPLTNLRTQQDDLDRLFTDERLFTALCGFFSVLALALVAVGLYGMVSYAVLRRTREIGVRMALGALPSRILRMILRDSLGPVLLGALVGIGASLAATRSIKGLLFDVPAGDPLTYLWVVTILVAVGVIACLLPARRASRVDPMVSLRVE